MANPQLFIEIEEEEGNSDSKRGGPVYVLGCVLDVSGTASSGLAYYVH